MVHLNQFRKQTFRLILPTLLVGKILYAEPIHFFNPLQKDHPTFQMKSFIANDPVSLNAFFNDWERDYTPKEGENLALLDTRADIGGTFDTIYIGYFHQYNIIVKAKKGFTDFYYAVKNKISLEVGNNYDLTSEIEGVGQHGLLLAKNYQLYSNDDARILLGAGIYASHGYMGQDGSLQGAAAATASNDYDIHAKASYYYSENYLYDLSVNNPNGFGYGMHFGLAYQNDLHGVGVMFLANDVAAAMHWNDMPYSYVVLETENKSYDEDGYVNYAPSISGLEKYKDTTQTIRPRYKVETSLALENGSIHVGMDRTYQINFPYIGVSYFLNDADILTLTHESRFGSFGIGYENNYFGLSLSLDSLDEPSAVGLVCQYNYRY